MTWTRAHIEQLARDGKIRSFTEKPKKYSGTQDKNIPDIRGENIPEAKPSKYHSRKTVVDGITFPSEKEAKRYGELKLLLKAGEIGLLQRQVEYELNPGGAFSYRYIADFVYVISKTGERVTEDAKGFRTKEYRKKKRLMKTVHGIEIKET